MPAVVAVVLKTALPLRMPSIVFLPRVIAWRYMPVAFALTPCDCPSTRISTAAAAQGMSWYFAMWP